VELKVRVSRLGTLNMYVGAPMTVYLLVYNSLLGGGGVVACLLEHNTFGLFSWGRKKCNSNELLNILTITDS
jgi:hypothetical protein